MTDWVAVADWMYRAVALVGGGGVLVWMARAIAAQKEAIGAQERTIKAQTEKMDTLQHLLKTMETVLKSTDEQAMLVRLEAYKKFVNHEKAAFAAQFEKEREELQQ